MRREYIQLQRPALHGLCDLAGDAPQALRMLLWVARQVGDTGRVQVAQDTMAAYLGVSVRQLQRHVDVLRRRDWIATTGRPGGALEYTTNPCALWYMRRDLLGWARRTYPARLALTGLTAWTPDPAWGLGDACNDDGIEHWIQVDVSVLCALGALAVECPAAMQTLFLLLADMGSGNRVPARTQGAMASYLGTTRRTVCRATALLRERAWVVPDGDAYYIINPAAVWTGRREDVEAAREAWPGEWLRTPTSGDGWYIPTRHKAMVPQIIGVPGAGEMDMDTAAQIE